MDVSAEILSEGVKSSGGLMAFSSPPERKSAVDRAARRIAEGRTQVTDVDLVNQWRAAHAYPLRRFYEVLQKQIAGHHGITSVQRLKRHVTVIDKLQRKTPEGKRLISHITSMNDLAGCRLIFRSPKDLYQFRAGFLTLVLSDVSAYGSKLY